MLYHKFNRNLTIILTNRPTSKIYCITILKCVNLCIYDRITINGYLLNSLEQKNWYIIIKLQSSIKKFELPKKSLRKTDIINIEKLFIP